MTNNRIDEIVDKLCSEVYEDWHLDVTQEVREEWRKPVRQTITELLEGLRLERVENDPDNIYGWNKAAVELDKKIDEILNN